MYDLPKTVTVKNREYHIRRDGDYRMVLDCLSALDDAELSESERILSSIAIFYDEIKSIEDIFVVFSKDDLQDAVDAMQDFMNGGDMANSGYHSNIKLIDWEQDEKLICSAINSVAKCEIRLVEYMHWWTFLSYYMSVGDSALTTVISIREKSAKGKKLEKWEQQFKRDNPQHFKWKKDTIEQKQAEDWLQSVWNKS